MFEPNAEIASLKEFNPHKDIPILLLAGGAGTRMKNSQDRKLSSRPKPLIAPTNTATLIDIALDGLCESGFRNSFILTRSGKEAQGERIERYVKKGIAKRLESEGVSIRFSREDTPLGTAGATSKAISEFGLQKINVITPTDTAFPFQKLSAAIQDHIDKGSSLTWIVTSDPGNTQNIGKILVDSESGVIRYNLEENKANGPDIDPDKVYKRRTSVGVLIVSSEYFTSKYLQMMFERADLANKPVDIYRDFIPWLLSKGETVNTFDIQKPAPDLGTPDRLQNFVKVKT